MDAATLPNEAKVSTNLKRTMLGTAIAVALSIGFTGSALAASVAAAARDGDFERVRELVSEGAAVNEAEADGSTAVLWAAYQSAPDVIGLLADAGADVNAPNRLGVTPLLQAARTGDVAVIRALLDAGADIEGAMLQGETPLMAAARTGKVEAVSLLLERGSDPNAVEGYENQTALMWAAAEGHAEVVGLLLDAGADSDAQARQNELTERSSRTDFPTGGFTAAMFAAREGHQDVLQRLADAGADLSLTNGDGATAMAIAIINDRFDLAASMLGMGAQPDVASLYHAVLMRDATTDWLAKDGSRWRNDYRNELTALDMIRVLLEAGGDPNAPFEAQMHSTSMCCDTKEKGSPFYRAAVASDVAALELLIEHGADVEWMPEAGDEGPGMGGPGPRAPRSPLVAAMNGGNGVGMAGGPGDIREGEDPPFREIADREPAHAMRVLLAAGADPNKPTANDSTLLHDAARARKLDVVEVLAEFGATLDALNGDGLTALDVVEGRRAEDAGAGPRGRGGFPGGPPGADEPEGPTNEDVAARLRELMQAAGVAIVEHGVVPEPGAETADGDA